MVGGQRDEWRLAETCMMQEPIRLIITPHEKRKDETDPVASNKYRRNKHSIQF